jgi:hypothetical protein
MSSWITVQEIPLAPGITVPITADMSDPSPCIACRKLKEWNERIMNKIKEEKTNE